MANRGRALAALAAPLPVLAACHFSVSAGGPDYPKLESAIADELNSQYRPLARQVSSVECPRPEQPPKAGDTLTCIADLDGRDVRVVATFTDGDNNVDFRTIDTVYDLADTEATLAEQISARYGFDVTVECGDGLEIVESGHTFECSATDPRGATRSVQVTAGSAGENDSWRIVE
ncbi:DUF4333 domain-containing protein [Mycolicibacterium sp. 3033]|nr:DUF4333 domain-containing protein [Mycolicibacterium aurantiacum]